ncbi:MAG: HypC/HybG/HupF family hydrogenase formation chaperone [Gammaproteobacteria bacterium]|jgi:hydrogenase expression/formation protein HypC
MCLGIPGQIVAVIDEANLLATVDVSGVRREVNIACIVDDGHSATDCIGDWVLVHVGFAMSRIDAEEARNTLELLDQLDELQNEMEAFGRA